MKIGLTKEDSKVVHSTDVYDVIDNDSLNKRIVSKTILHPNMHTTGHKHAGQEEVYIFTKGNGFMEIDEQIFDVTKGDVVLIQDGAFHRVYNRFKDDLEFICVFDGGRNH